MEENRRKVIEWLTYVKERELWGKPDATFAYICDAFYHDARLILLYKEALRSDAISLFVREYNDNCVDVQYIYESQKSRVSDHNTLVELLMALCLVFGVEDKLELSDDANPLPPNDYKVILEKSESEKSAEEYYNLACACRTDKGIADTKLYVDYMGKSSEMGYLPAMKYMARFYLRGKYVEKDENKGIDLYQKCAAIGDGDSYYELYRYFNRTGNNGDKGTEYLKFAVEHGVTAALYDLGMKYYDSGIETDYLKAYELFLQASQNGDAGAFYQLALCYQFGRGTIKNLGEAKKMLEEAAKRGHQSAKSVLQQLEK